MPDIDVDFEDGRRDEVIAYVGRKYGQDHVAQIITFGTMLARAAIRDVGRVLGHSYGEVDRIAKAVPNPARASRSRRPSETAPSCASRSRRTRRSSGSPTSHGISKASPATPAPTPPASSSAASRSTELMPLQKATNSDALMTQYEMHAIEAMGLLKFDFLGLSNLTILRQAVDFVQEHRGIDIDLDAIPLDDAKTFELLASGETTGIFQLESAGMRRYIRELRPTSVHDLAAMVALYRPGPDGQHPGLHPPQARAGAGHLPPSAARAVPGEDLRDLRLPGGHHVRGRRPRRLHRPEADTLGYAIRKKKSSVLRAQKERVRHAGAPSAASTPSVIDAVFHAFEPFERYGFNKAHATCYGLIAYQTAYLKANHTVDYMTAVLTALPASEEKVAAAVAECRRMGIDVLPPDVHASHLEFTVEGDAIRFGLLAVKNVGQGAIEVDHRGARRRRTIPLADRPLHPHRPAAREPARSSRRSSRSGRCDALRASGAAPARARRRDRVGPGDPARPDHRPDLALRPGRGDADCPRATVAGGDGGAGPRAAALGEGAARPVPLRAPDGRGRGAGRSLRERLLGRPQGRGARRPADRRRRHRHRDPDRHHEAPGGDGHRHPRGPPGLDRGRRLPAPVRDEPADVARRAILLVAGRVDHKGEEVSLLADLAADWTTPPLAGPRRSHARSRGRSLRRARRPTTSAGTGRPGSGLGTRWQRGRPTGDGLSPTGGRQRRAAAGRDAADPARRTDPGLPRAGGRGGDRGDAHDLHEEPAVPDEARARIVADATADAPVAPVRAPSCTSGSSTPRRPTGWSARWRRSRPCCVTDPGRRGSSSTCPRRGRNDAAHGAPAGVAYDAELLAEVRRRLGDGLVDLRLASA